jgi:ankyrin repeat protein
MTGTCIEKMSEVYKYGDTSKILKLYLNYFRYLEDLISKINQKDSVERMRATYQAFKFAKKLVSLSKRPEYASSKVNLSAAQNFLQSCEQPSTQSILKKAILKMLKQRGISVPREKRNDIYALIHSAIQNDVGEPIELAFAMGKNVGDINEPIASFSRVGVIEVVPALHAAAIIGAIESMGAIMRIGADIDKLIYQEESRKAEKDNDQEAISRLTSSGAALHYAATNEKVDSVKFLLEQGAQPDIKNFFGFTPKSTAEQVGHKEIATLLENAQKVAKEKVERNNDSSATLVGKLGLQGEQQRQRANKNDAGSDDVVRMNNQQMIPKG